jgi:hypothetical protein
MAYSPHWTKRLRQARQLPMLNMTADRHRPALEEVDLGAGRGLILPTQPPLVRGTFCAFCWGAGAVLEPGPLGLGPVYCECCSGRGWT